MTPDGVDFEASVAYHRLVAELFLLPALYRRACGLDVPAEYRERLVAMARFTAAYARPDGGTPLWGDADDARALPLGSQALTDHRYLPGLVGAAFDVPELRDASAGSRSEAFWLLGPAAAAALPEAATPPRPPRSRAFPDGGFYVLRNEADHVFVDCGPVGLAGRGGHGHNDCLSFEAALDGVHLVTDCGAFVYTASFAERNRFRSTAFHNTPCVDGAEMNRLQPDLLWSLEYDARPVVRRFETGTETDIFCGAHAGYGRLPAPVTPVRTIVLDHRSHALTITDAFEGAGRHRIEIPLHLAPGVTASEEGAGPPGPASRRPGLLARLGAGRVLEPHDRRGARVALLRGRGCDRSTGLHPRGWAPSRAHGPHRPGGSTVTTRPWPYHCRMRPGEKRP